MNAYGEEPIFTSDPNKYNEWLSQSWTSFINVGNMERLLSVIGGVMLVGYALRRSVWQLVLLATGAALAYRGVSGHCYLYEAAHINKTQNPATDTSTVPVAIKPKRTETVEEASWESFPASDAPAWTGGSFT